MFRDRAHGNLGSVTTSIGDTVDRARALLGPLDWDETSVNDRGELVLPSGTVTLLLADVEGSTRGWEERAEEMTGALEDLGEMVDATLGWHQGVRPVEQGEGDSFVAAFSRASDAVACALEIQRQLAPNPLLLRMGVHTGEVQLRDEGNYAGPAINRTARLRDAAHGGQVVLSQATCELVRDRLPDGVALRDLGVHRLKDLGRPEHVYQLVHPELGDNFPPLRSVDHLPNNLPAQLTSFVGREPELAVLRKLLGETRMLTLTGSGGCGKTRLALELAARALERFPDGTWLVDLTPVTDPDLVPNTVATAMGVRAQPGRRSTDALVDHLASQTALVVLDNCEHLVDAAAELAEQMLLGCPGVTVLATSREQLGVPGETAWRVPSLSFPKAHEPPRIDELAQYESVQLFVERARKVRPNFTIDSTTAAPVAAICHRLDGIPLAVELAAARTRVLSPQQILDGLDDRFRLLTGGARTAVARQQTLRASVDWSYELLTDDERRVFARLSVFAGGFSLDAAEVVAGAEPVGAFAVLDLLQSLADRSLLVVADSPRRGVDAVRYRMLETIRQYAGERLADSDEAESVRTRHCEFYVALAERAAPHLERSEQETWADRLDVENENVRVAFWHAHDRGDAERAQRLVAALFWWWIIRGHLNIGAKVCRLALELPGPVRPEVRAAALVAACQVGWFRVDASVMPLAQEAVDAAREAGDRRLEGRALYLVGMWAGFGGTESVDSLEASITIAREVGDRWGLAIALTAAGTALNDAGPAAAAAPVLEEALAVCDDLGERYIANTVRYKLATVQLRLGRTAEGEAMLRGVIAHARGTGDIYSLSMALADLGLSRALQGDLDGGIAMVEEDVEMLRRNRQSWPQHELQAYGILGYLLLRAGRFEEARAPLDAAETAGRAVSPMADAVVALTLSLRARVERALGDVDRARALAADALALLGSSYAWPAVPTRHNAACIALETGDLDLGERLAHEALATATEAGDRVSFTETVPVLDTLATITDDARRGARLLGAVDALMQYAGHVRDEYARERYDEAVKRLRDELGADDFEAAVDEGARLSLHEAIAYAQRGRGQRRRPARGWDSLTPTELEVVKLVAEGLSNPDIAERLFVSRKTVTTHLTHVFAKLGVSSRSELASMATRQGV